MKNKAYTATWLSNISVALIAVGGFQSEMPVALRIFALSIATVAFFWGKKINKEL